MISMARLKPLFTILILSSFQGLYAQNSILEWAIQMEGDGAKANSSTIDNLGNVYTTGTFYSTSDFDPSSGVEEFTALGNGDAYIQKVDENGNFIWVKHIGSESIEYGHSVSVDNLGNVYTIGMFKGLIDLDPGPGVYELDAGGVNQTFIQKLDANGDFVWAKELKGFTSVSYGASALDDLGNFYLTGFFQGTVDFDPGVGEHELLSTGISGGFILKLDVNGEFQWVKHLSEGEHVKPTSIALDNSGNIYTTGSFIGTSDFNPGIGYAFLSSHGLGDIFTLKLDNNGDFVWVKNVGNENWNSASKVLVDNLGNVYTLGSFRGTIDFDPGSGVENHTSGGSNVDAFIQKLDGNGDFVWVKQIGGEHSASINTAAMDQLNNIYLGGSFTGVVDFDPSINIAHKTSLGERDMFLSKFDDNGNYSWVVQFGGAYNEDVSSVLVDQTGHIYLSGEFASIVDFEPGQSELFFDATGKPYQGVILKLPPLQSTIGQTEFDTQGSLNVFPNPFKSHLTLEFNEPVNDVICSVLDIMGKEVYRGNYDQLSKTSLKLDVKPGLYYLTISTKSQVKTLPIVKL